MKTDTEIVHRMKQLEKQRPSVYGNFFLIGLLQLSTFLGGIALLLLTVYLLAVEKESTLSPAIESCKEHIYFLRDLNNTTLALLCLCCGILLLFIHILTKMINRRNAFLMEFMQILEPDEKP